MAAEFAANAIFGTDDLPMLRRILHVDAGVTTFDEDIKVFVNEASDWIENKLTVNNGLYEFKGIVKARTFTDVKFTPSGIQNSFTPHYPIVSVSSLKYSDDYSSWTDYPGNVLVVDKFQIGLSDANFSSRPVGTKITYVCGFSVIPDTIKKVAKEMIHRAAQDSNIKDLGGNYLGKSSEGIGSQSQFSVSFDKTLEDKWDKILKPYKRPNFATQAAVQN